MTRVDLVAAVVTVSDGVTEGTREDRSGDEAARLLGERGWAVATRTIVPDERPAIERALRDLAGGHALIVTTGGTGFGPRDVTPEATRAVIDREAPGLAELMRASGLHHTPMAALSRAAAGTIGTSLVINLPGSPGAVRESLEALMPVLDHAVELLGGATGAHPAEHGHDAGGPGAGSHGSPERAGTVTITAVKQMGAPPCPVGARIILGTNGPIEGTLGCAEFDAAAIETAADALGRGAGPETRVFHHELGDIEVFVEPHPAPPLLVVVSATPVALELLRVGRALGFTTQLIESRPERISPAHRAAADTVVPAADPGTMDPRTAAVHTDHDAPGVADAIATMLRSPAGFIGVMGSRRHVGPHVERLREMGFQENDLKRVRSPVGIDIGATTAQEIALSIAAGLVAARSGREGGWLDRP
jgi:molybdopterin adenylyltransferase